MAETGGTVYTANDINALLQDTANMLAEQRSGVPDNYPADYIYYPLLGNDGNPSTAKVGDEYLSAWMKRSEVGGNFDTIALFTKNQLDEIYNLRPDSLPDVAGGQAKVTKYTGKQVYVNPDLGHEVSPGDFSEVYFDKKTGEILNKPIEEAEKIAFDANATSYDNKTSYQYQRALLPKSVTADLNVSQADLKQQLYGYKLSDQIVNIHSKDSANKAIYEKFLIEAISGIDAVYEGQNIKVGGVISYLAAVSGGNQDPAMIVEDKNLIYNVSNIGFEDVLYGEQNKIEPQSQQETVVIVKETKLDVLPEPVKEQFNSKSQEVVEIPAGTTEKLDKIMSELSTYVNGDDVRQRQVNRYVIPALKYLRDVVKYDGLFDIEAQRLESALRDLNLGEHADIISDYAADPSRDVYKAAKVKIRAVNIQENIRPSKTPVLEDSKHVTPEEAIKALKDKGVQLPDGFKRKVHETYENVNNISDKRMEEGTQRSMDHGNANLVEKFVNVATGSGNPDIAQQIIENISDTLSPKIVEQVCEEVSKKSGFETVTCNTPQIWR